MVNFGESGESYPIECIYRYMYHVRSFESDARWRSDGTVRIAWIVLPNDYAATAVLSRAIGDGRRVSGHPGVRHRDSDYAGAGRRASLGSLPFASLSATSLA